MDNAILGKKTDSTITFADQGMKEKKTTAVLGDQSIHHHKKAGSRLHLIVTGIAMLMVSFAMGSYGFHVNRDKKTAAGKNEHTSGAQGQGQVIVEG